MCLSPAVHHMKVVFQHTYSPTFFCLLPMQHFEKIGTISTVLIAKRRGESQGYGFVQFLKRADAQKALREMNESTLEDHKLQIKLSEKTLVYVVFVNLFHIYM